MTATTGKRWLKPMQIAKLGLIKNSKGDEGSLSGHYDYIIELIKTGRLKAKDYSKGDKPYYLVSEEEIERYHNTVE